MHIKHERKLVLAHEMEAKRVTIERPGTARVARGYERDDLVESQPLQTSFLRRAARDERMTIPQFPAKDGCRQAVAAS